MEITTFTIGRRDEALLVGDYNSYRSQLTRQLQAVRRRLGRATPKNAKFQKKAPVTSANVKENREYAHLLLLSAEREWAHAMSMKSSQSEDNTGQDVSGATRSHVISKLTKGSKYAKELATLLEDRSVSGSTDGDMLEIRAYQASLSGAAEFEKQSEGHRSKEELANKDRWNDCLRHYATARVIYAALQAQSNKEVYREFLANTIDPTIRYAAYQARMSRTVAVSTVAIKYFPQQDQELATLVKAANPNAFVEQPAAAAKQESGAVGEIPSHITWRGRKADIVDAAIGQALAQVAAAEQRLTDFLKSKPDASARDKAAAYDEVLIASQDAVDATHSATVELEKEGVDEGDARMQNLRVSGLAVNYELVSWRVGRNRVLIGNEDGITFTEPKAKHPKRARKDGKEWSEKSEPRAKKLARLRERVVLYDASIQSLDTIKDLRGAMRDNAFVQELEGKRAYFQALKCLNIATSHTLLSAHLNALALFSRASTLAQTAAANIPSTDRDTQSPPTLAIHPSAAQRLSTHLSAQVQRYTAIADLAKFHTNSRIANEKNMTSAAPLVQRISDYPTPGVDVDLKNLVAYPPRIEPVPVKPLFFDVAWNYIDYPGRAKMVVESIGASTANPPLEEEGATTPAADEGTKKRGWFGFGR